MYDAKKKIAYKHVLESVPYLGYSLKGVDEGGEYFYINPENIEKIQETLSVTKKGKEIYEALCKTMSKDESLDNPYILYLSYK